MPIPLTVDAADVAGQLFSEHTFLLGMKAHNCVFQSKHKMSVDSPISLEINYSTVGLKACRVRGRVKWLQAVPTTTSLFNVGVEIDSTQGMPVIPEVCVDHPMVRDSTPVNQPHPADGRLSREMEDRIQAAIASHVDRIVRDSVETQITHLETFAASERMQVCFEAIATRVAERLNRLSQQVLSTTEKGLNDRVAALRQSAEESIQQMQARIDEAQISVREASAKAQAVKEHSEDTVTRIETALDRARGAANGTARLDTWSVELTKRLDQIIVDSTARCIRDMEQQISPQLQEVDEKLRTLAAGLQLAQLEQDRLAKLSMSSVTNCEREMRAFFLRLSADA